MQAIANKGLTLVDTEYLNAAHNAPQAQQKSAYGVELAKLKAERDKKIQAAKDDFDKARDELRARLQGTAA